MTKSFDLSIDKKHFNYAMKANPVHLEQLMDRASKFKELDMNPKIELHLSGLECVRKKVDAIVENCAAISNCEYLVHFPLFDGEINYIFDPCNGEEDNIAELLEVCKKIGSDKLILHRCYGFDKKIDKKTAKNEFLEKVVLWNRLAAEFDVAILVENYGFVWLPDGLEKEYIISTLDHFFPWEIKEFRSNIKNLRLDNVGIVLDVAHATLSSNMFNMLKTYSEFQRDPRFGNISEDDLSKVDWLDPSDFIFDFIDCFHLSDSFVWGSINGVKEIDKFLYSEGLPIGSGNINYNRVLEKICNNKILVMEINPENGQHENNCSQFEGIKKIKQLIT